MQTFTVLRRVDAYVNYETQIQAENANEATMLARAHDTALDWQEMSTTTFDARLFVALDEDGREIESTQQGDF